MDSREALVSIGLPVRNGAETLRSVAKSVLEQDHERLELIISDNASTDGTEELCRELAARDDRVVYHRQSSNVGLLPNFIQTMQLAKGSYFRWVGDDDWLAPTYVSRCLEEFAEDDRLILVTTRLNYVNADGTSLASPQTAELLSSEDPLDRFERYIHYLVEGDLPVDPLYGLARRTSLLPISRRNMIREDEVFAGMLALAGPWGHVPEILGTRHLGNLGLRGLTRLLGVPVWQAYVPTTVQCWALLRGIRNAGLTRSQRRRARAAVGRLFVLRHYRRMLRGRQKLSRALAGFGTRAAADK